MEKTLNTSHSCEDTKHSCYIFCWFETGFYWAMHASCLMSAAFQSFYMTCVMGCQEKSCISYIKITTLPKKCCCLFTAIFTHGEKRNGSSYSLIHNNSNVTFAVNFLHTKINSQNLHHNQMNILLHFTILNLLCIEVTLGPYLDS